MGQTDITVTDAKATLRPTIGGPSTVLWDLLGIVEPRVTVDYGAARYENIIPVLNAELLTQLEQVSARMIMLYAKANRSYTLAYPTELVNDQTAPQLLGNVTQLLGATANSLQLTWETSEYAISTLEYGTATNSYSQKIVIDSYETNNRIEVPNLEADTTYYGRINMVDLSGNQANSPEFTFALSAGPAPDAKPLVLIYAVLDNNLGDNGTDLARLITNVEKGAHAGIDVRLMIDGPGNDDSYVYEIQPGDNPCIYLNGPTCDGRYKEGTNYWKFSENTAHPETLSSFVVDNPSDSIK